MTTTAEALAQEVVDLAVNGGWTDAQLPYVQWFAPRVDAGAAFMDAVYPEWPVAVLEAAGQETFRMHDAQECVLGHTAAAIADRLLTDSARDIVTDYSSSPNFHSIHHLFSMMFRVDPEGEFVGGNLQAGNHICRALGLSLEDDDTPEQESSLAWGVLGDLWLIHARRRTRLTPVEIADLQRRRDELVTALADNEAELGEIERQLTAAGVELA